jgi:hypothetical protein
VQQVQGCFVIILMVALGEFVQVVFAIVLLAQVGTQQFLYVL